MIDYVVGKPDRKVNKADTKPKKKQPEKIEIKKHKQRKQTQKPIRPKRQYKNKRQPH